MIKTIEKVNSDDFGVVYKFLNPNHKVLLILSSQWSLFGQYGSSNYVVVHKFKLGHPS